MVRLIVLPSSTFRIFAPGEVVDRGVVVAAGEYVVEWAGRVGHPSSYGCLGGRGATSAGAAVGSVQAGRRFSSSLAGSGDIVCWGLPDEYRAALDDGAPDLIITRAAHGQASSSVEVFSSLARVLLLILRSGGRASDQQVQSAWERRPSP